MALVPIAGAAPLTIYANTMPIVIPDAATAVPYPSPISVSMSPIFVTDVNVTLSDITHDFSDDIDVLLVGPAGQKVVLMSDAGGGGAVVATTITLDDAAGTPLPDEDPLVDGASYKPGNYDGSATAGCEAPDESDVGFPAPAPGSPYASTLAAFFGSNPNGTWNLYVLDDCMLFAPANSIAGGWSLDITAVNPSAVRVTQLTAAERGGSVAVRWRTATETSVLGFNVYRAGGEGTTKLNHALIQVKAGGRTGGASYVLVDRRVRANTSYTYRLQAVERNGQRSWIGSVSTRTPRPR